MSSVSVIIPTHNRGECLRRTIWTYLADACVNEVIIVDDGSTDDTLEVCNLIADQDHRVKVFHQLNKGAPSARNTGILKVSNETDYIFFGEDDAYLEEQAINNLLRYMNETSADIAGGLIVPIDGLEADRKRKPVHKYSSNPVNLNLLRADFKTETEKTMEVPFIHALFLAKKWVFQELRFDENYYGNAYREETDFCLEAAKGGAKIIFCPQSALYHVEAPQGGQRRIPKLSYELAVINNNWYFLNKHYAYLKNRYHIYTPKAVLQILLLLRRSYLYAKYFLNR